MTGSAILKVAVAAPLPRLFDYLPPEGPPAAVDRSIRPGCRVRVTFGRSKQVGLVLDVAAESEVPRDKLKRADALLDTEPVFGADDLWLIRFTSDYYHHPIGECAAAAMPALLRQGRALEVLREVVVITDDGRSVDPTKLARRAPKQAELLTFLAAQERLPVEDLDERCPGWRRLRRTLLDKGWIEVVEETDVPTSAGEIVPTSGPSLSHEQQRAVDAITASSGFSTTLVDGVTGSGKTEVYLRIMRDIVDAGRQVLILVPEIGLTPQFVARLEERMGMAPALLHSSLTDNERLSAWRAARDGSARLILGTRSAVFVPMKDPGLIVVDEEHDASFKQQEGLRYSARDLAIARGKKQDVPVILGSATPSLESLGRAAEGAYRHVTLTARAGGALPPHLRLVDLNRFPADDGLSQPLVAAIGKHLAADGQVLIFLNRRGFAPTLICTECGHIAECERCDSRMTVHRGDQSLCCHHCGASRPLDEACSQCGGRPLPLGQGTERIEDALRERFPEQTITRVDSDSTRLKGTMDRALAMAVSGEARILVGTQMLSKGHHFPRLTLVGVVNADQGLFSTDFRGGERLAQSLIQVAGRAGRERAQGEVLIQTAFAEHPFWPELLGGGYHQVARFALVEREATGWPPFSRLALIRASAHKREHTWGFLDAIASRARELRPEGVRVLGPVNAPMERLAGRYRGQLLLQCTHRQPLHRLLSDLQASLADDARARRVRWSIDVDPIELF